MPQTGAGAEVVVSGAVDVVETPASVVVVVGAAVVEVSSSAVVVVETAVVEVSAAEVSVAEVSVLVVSSAAVVVVLRVGAVVSGLQGGLATTVETAARAKKRGLRWTIVSVRVKREFNSWYGSE